MAQKKFMENLMVCRTTLVFFEVLFFVSVCCAQRKDTSSASSKSPSSARRNVGRYDEVEHAKESDLVLFGKVVEVVDLPGPSSELFHSEALVRIDSALKGTPTFKTVILLKQSGSISENNSHHKIAVSGETTFKVGERSIFFLQRPDKNNYLISPFIQGGFYYNPLAKQNDQSHYKTSFYGRQFLNELPDSVFFGDYGCRDVIINDTVFVPRGRETVESLVKKIRDLSQTINH